MFPGDLLENFCESDESTSRSIILEWRATYFRAADLKQYTKSRYGFIDSHCEGVHQLENFYSVSGDSLVWRDEGHRAAWACFAATRNTFEQADFDNVIPNAQDLLQGKVNR